jgi:hydroxyacylglutathione hydrolase
MPKINAYVDFYPGWAIQANAYGIHTSDAYVLIDPVVGPDRLEADLADQVRMLVSTHGHFDHNLSAEAWLKHRPDIPFYMSQADTSMAQDETQNVSALFGMPMTYPVPQQCLVEGQSLNLDKELSLDIFACPGHSPGSVLLLLKDGAKNIALFTGDVVFQDSIGRTDLPGGSAEDMAASLAKLKELGQKRNFPPDLPILSGHGPDTTWAALLRMNPWL